MPRGPRLDIKGALHHIMVRGLEARQIFLSDGDRQDFVDRLAAVVPVTGASLYAWSLMPNHAHLLLRTGRESVSRMMRRVMTGYAVTFNRRHKRVGHLFQNRFKSILVEEEPYLLELVRYIHLNPVRARVVQGIDELDTYAWSGHSALMGNLEQPWQDVAFVLQQFGQTLDDARGGYREFVLSGVDQGRRFDLTGGGLVRSAGGRENLPVLGRGREKWAHDERVLGSSDFVERVVGEAERAKSAAPVGCDERKAMLHRLIRGVAAKSALEVAEVLGGGRRRSVARARYAVAYVAVCGGYGAAEVARELNTSIQTVLRGCEQGEGVLEDLGLNAGDFAPEVFGKLSQE